MRNLSSRLLHLQEQDEQAGQGINRTEGEIKQITDRMDQQFGVSDIDKAESLLKKKVTLKAKKEDSLEADLKVLEAEYVFD